MSYGLWKWFIAIEIIREDGSQNASIFIRTIPL